MAAAPREASATGSIPGLEFGADRRLSGRIAIVALDWSGAPANLTFGSARELTPGLTPWDTATFWTKSFVSSAKHFATDIYNTFTLSHPGKEGVITTGTRDWADYAAINAVYAEYFPGDKPARYCIQAGLVRPDFLVEIASVAHVGKR